MAFRILHLAPDEKFIPLVQDLYEEAFPEQNTFRIHDISDPKSRHAKKIHDTKFVEPSYYSTLEFLKELNKCDCLLLHSMRPCFEAAIKSAPSRVTVVWTGWGFEYYELLRDQIGSIVLPRTCRIQRQNRLKNLIKLYLHPIQTFKEKFTKERTLSPNSYTTLKNVAHRINVFSVNSAEETMLRKALPTMNAQFHMLHYYTIEDTLSQGIDKMDGDDILLGNSASYTNNHVDALYDLKKMNIKGRRIVAPLSYGDDDYAKRVIQFGNRLFGSSFFPLRNFLPIKDYNNLIGNCGVVIMNHIRQQAVGNISAALYKGANVFLRRENPLFNFFTGIGAKVFPFGNSEEISLDTVNIENRCRLKTKRAMENLWNRHHVVENIKKLEDFHIAKRGIE